VIWQFRQKGRFFMNCKMVTKACAKRSLPKIVRGIIVSAGALLTIGAAEASIIDANRPPLVKVPASNMPKPEQEFLNCVPATDDEATTTFSFLRDPSSPSEGILVYVSSAATQPVIYVGKVSYIGGSRMDYSFAPQPDSGEYLYVVSTFFAGPEGRAVGYFSGSGVSGKQLSCQYTL
jgi:hypothetical protein